ncbi:MAG: pirin family protein [Candidatus Moraniibacteriota bacterium]
MHKAHSRGYVKQGWLETRHSFSFASYYNPERMGFGALRVINDDTIAAGQGFGRHPHENMEIITIPLSGALAHEDSMGNAAMIQTGEVQVMSAGTGVEHAEFNASQTEAVSLLQIWILTRAPGVVPRYEQKPFDAALFQNAFYLVVGPEASEQSGALSIHQDAFLSLGRFDTDTSIEYALRKEEQGVYFFVIDGAVTIEGQALEKRDAIGLWETERVHLQAKKGAFVLAIEVPMVA